MCNIKFEMLKIDTGGVTDTTVIETEIKIKNKSFIVRFEAGRVLYFPSKDCTIVPELSLKEKQHIKNIIMYYSLGVDGKRTFTVLDEQNSNCTSNEFALED